MRISLLLVQGLHAAGVAAARGRRIQRQTGTLDPGIPSDCTYWDIVTKKSENCAYFEDLYGLEHKQFVEYNPSVKSDCSGIQEGHSYCVEVNHGIPREDNPAVTSVEDTSPEPTQDNKPSPTQDGLIDTCTTFYKAKKGDTCAKIIAEYKTFEFAEFFKWNRAVDKDCSGIWADTWYCVGVPGTPTAPATQTSVSSIKPTGATKPSPTQEGLIDNCVSFYQAKKGDTCARIIAEHKSFNFDSFFKWNPAIDKDCSGIWAGYWYCVGVPGTPTGVPTKTTATPSKTAGPSKPSVTQEGLIESCNSFHQAAKGETCAKIVSNYGTFDFNTFFKWNPAIGKDCSGIWASYYYCVGVPGTPTSKPSATSPKPTATGGVETPSPLQEGIAKNCNKFHQVTKTTTCYSIENYYKLPLSLFLTWNPAVGKDCSGLWADYWVCVSVEGYKPSTTTTAKATTTKPANGIQTPSPIQNGMVKNCEKFHQIKSTTTCTSIENYYNLPFATFLSWNPAVGKDCKSLLTNYWVCVATIGWKPPTKTTTKAATTTKPANGIKTPPPVQPGMVSNCNKFHMVQKTTTCDSIQKYYKISLADFVKWNPAVGSKCTGLWADYNVCVGVIGGTPTKPDNGVKTPSPIQPGMVSNCKKFHEVASTTTCDSIQKYYKITMAQLAKWNPAVGTKCTALWAKYWVCVGV
ncbi:uncharacterized protein FFB20_06853 [Fusarium fujikuroi]|uniref:Uncharacterized protein n=1 Tax=Fusarium fujikuroi TaxID=5127 RepID=A0A2H3S350_FUSFU|nr:uncharacterized protein Y057_1056 [Fusarium fujikuroi]QGI69682.1 hypothetical protein CEK27_002011 [Fusarium fujikuroi]QGJ00570.1 hypothetical protein CEK26_002014 [Fusarium fujikuroi]SCN82652.1 uncharacterized protein FFB20_06853 [Fusarium fujikuroi]SCO09347.1 uncharacterized protein FFC1_11096 [Fusarium fujikuroi]